MATRWFPFDVRGNSKVDEPDKRDSKVERPDESGSKVEKPDTRNETPSVRVQNLSKRFGRKGPQPTGTGFGSLLPRSRKKSGSAAVPQTIQTAKGGGPNASRDDPKTELCDNNVTQRKQMVDGRGLRHLAASSVQADGDNSPLQQEQIKSYGDEITLT